MNCPYYSLLKQLLPQGRIWNIEPGSRFENLLTSCSLEFERVHKRAQQLLQEMNPLSSQELLPEWEKIMGLDPNCTLLERQMNLAQALSDELTSSRESLIHAAQTIGVSIEVTDPIGDGFIYSPEWESILIIEIDLPQPAPNEEQTLSRKRAQFNEILNKIKPAHIKIVLRYNDSV